MLHSDTTSKRNPSGEARAVSQIVRFVRLSIPTKGLFPLSPPRCTWTIRRPAAFNPYQRIIPIITPEKLHSLSIPTKGLFPLSPGWALDLHFQSLPKDYSHCHAASGHRNLKSANFQSLPKDYSHCHGCAYDANAVRLCFQSLPKDYSHCH